MVDLAHPRIETGDHFVCTRLLRQRGQRADGNDRQSGAKSEPLGNAASDSETGKGSRSGTEGNAVKLPQCKPGGGQQFLDHGEDQLGMPLDGMRLAMRKFLAAQECGRAIFRGSIEGEKVQSVSAAADRSCVKNYSGRSILAEPGQATLVSYNPRQPWQDARR